MSIRRAFAEVVGTFVLVFGGVGSAVIAGEQIGNLGVAFAFGLSLLVMAYAIGPVSGCHINPAVTLGLLARGKIDGSEALRYWVAQVVGAVAAAGLLLAIVSARKAGYDAATDGLGANGYGAHSPDGYPGARRWPSRSCSRPSSCSRCSRRPTGSPTWPSPGFRSAWCSC